MQFSIIIKTLNEEKNLERLLIAIKKQSVQDYEIIVSDGKSTDKTLEIAKKYGCKIISSKDKNLGAAMNKGAKIATGEILVFPDADIKIDNLFLERIGNALKDKKVTSGFYYILAYDSFLSNLFSYGPSIILVNLLRILRLDMAFGPSMFFRKKIFKELKGFNEEVLLEDVEMFTRISKKKLKYKILTPPIRVSARRIVKKGILKQSILYIKYWMDIKLNKKLKREYHEVYKPFR